MKKLLFRCFPFNKSKNILEKQEEDVPSSSNANINQISEHPCCSHSHIFAAKPQHSPSNLTVPLISEISIKQLNERKHSDESNVLSNHLPLDLIHKNSTLQIITLANESLKNVITECSKVVSSVYNKSMIINGKHSIRSIKLEFTVDSDILLGDTPSWNKYPQNETEKTAITHVPNIPYATSQQKDIPLGRMSLSSNDACSNENNEFNVSYVSPVKYESITQIIPCVNETHIINNNLKKIKTSNDRSAVSCSSDKIILEKSSSKINQEEMLKGISEIVINVSSPHDLDSKNNHIKEVTKDQVLRATEKSQLKSKIKVDAPEHLSEGSINIDTEHNEPTSEYEMHKLEKKVINNEIILQNSPSGVTQEEELKETSKIVLDDVISHSYCLDEKNNENKEGFSDQQQSILENSELKLKNKVNIPMQLLKKHINIDLESREVFSDKEMQKLQEEVSNDEIVLQKLPPSITEEGKLKEISEIDVVFYPYNLDKKNSLNKEIDSSQQQPVTTTEDLKSEKIHFETLMTTDKLEKSEINAIDKSKDKQTILKAESKATLEENFQEKPSIAIELGVFPPIYRLRESTENSMLEESDKGPVFADKPEIQDRSNVRTEMAESVTNAMIDIPKQRSGEKKVSLKELSKETSVIVIDLGVFPPLYRLRESTDSSIREDVGLNLKFTDKMKTKERTTKETHMRTKMTKSVRNVINVIPKQESVEIVSNASLKATSKIVIKLGVFPPLYRLRESTDSSLVESIEDRSTSADTIKIKEREKDTIDRPNHAYEDSTSICTDHNVCLDKEKRELEIPTYAFVAENCIAVENNIECVYPVDEADLQNWNKLALQMRNSLPFSIDDQPTFILMPSISDIYYTRSATTKRMDKKCQDVTETAELIELLEDSPQTQIQNWTIVDRDMKITCSYLKHLHKTYKSAPYVVHCTSQPTVKPPLHIFTPITSDNSYKIIKCIAKDNRQMKTKKKIKVASSSCLPKYDSLNVEGEEYFSSPSDHHLTVVLAPSTSTHILVQQITKAMHTNLKLICPDIRVSTIKMSTGNYTKRNICRNGQHDIGEKIRQKKQYISKEIVQPESSRSKQDVVTKNHKIKHDQSNLTKEEIYFLKSSETNSLDKVRKYKKQISKKPEYSKENVIGAHPLDKRKMYPEKGSIDKSSYQSNEVELQSSIMPTSSLPLHKGICRIKIIHKHIMVQSRKM